MRVLRLFKSPCDIKMFSELKILIHNQNGLSTQRENEINHPVLNFL